MIQAVNWPEFEDAYGSAEQVPALLHALTSTNRRTRQNAAATLGEEVLAHEGQRFSASLAAIPYLLDLLDDEACLDRHNILAIFVSIAVGAPV